MPLTLRKFKQFVEVPQVCLRNGAVFFLNTGGCDTPLFKAYWRYIVGVSLDYTLNKATGVEVPQVIS